MMKTALFLLKLNYKYIIYLINGDMIMVVSHIKWCKNWHWI